MNTNNKILSIIPALAMVFLVSIGLTVATGVSNTAVATNDFGPDTTDNLIYEFTLDASGDTIIHTGAGTSAGNALASFGGITSSAFVNDGTGDGDGTAGYQDGDEVFSVTQVHAGTTDISDGGTVYTFPATTVYADDSTTAGQYDDGDDLYTFTTHVGSPAPADSGTAYQTFLGTTEFINAPATPSATFDGTQPIITGSSDNTLGNGEAVARDGSAGILSALSSTNYQHYDDASGTASAYDNDGAGGYGEAIYDNVGTNPGAVEAASDTRITSVTVNSGSSDADATTIDLGLGTFAAVASDADNGKTLTSAAFQVIKYEYGTDDTEPDWEDTADDIYLDVDGSGTVTEGDIVLADNEGTNSFAAGTQLTSTQASDVQSETPTAKVTISADVNFDNAGGATAGTYENGDNVYLDIGSDDAAGASRPDFQLTGGSVAEITATPGTYNSQAGAAIDTWDADGSTSQTVADSVYVDMGGTGAVATDDVRLAGFTKTFSAGSSVSSGDVDVGVSIVSFASDETYLDDNNGGTYDNGEAIVQSSDTNYGSADTVLVQGTFGTVRADFRSGSSPFDAFEKSSGDYTGTEPIITVTNAFPTTSGTRNTVPAADSSITLNGFETGTGNIEGFVTASGSTYVDDEEIVRLARFTTTSGTQLSISDSSSAVVNAFAAATKFDDSEGDATYDDNEAIIDDGDSNGVYGDTLTHVTINNDGGLSNSALGAGNIIIYKDAGTAGFQGSGTDTQLGTGGAFGTQIDITDDSTASTQKYFVAVNIPSNIAASEDGNTIIANPTTTTVSGDNPDPTANANPQTVHAPHVTDVASVDTDTDGQIDRVTVTFSEAIDVSEGADAGDAFTGFTLDDASFAAANANYDTTGTTTVNIDLASAIGDTSSTTTATYSTAADSITTNTGSYELTEDMSAASSTDSAKPTITDLAISDTAGDGLIDDIVVTFSENINTDDSNPPVASDFGTITLPDGSSAGLGSATFTDPAGASSTVTISSITGQSTANTAAGSTDISGITASDWTDGTNNLVSTLDDETITDNAAPVILASNIVGTTVEGGGDTIDVTFTEDVTGAGTKGNWDDFQSPSGTSLTITTAGFSYSNPTLTVTLDESTDGEFLKNGDAVVVDPSAASISDGSGQDVADASVTSSSTVSGDSSAPTVSSITTKDRDSDGQVDSATVVFNEAVDDSTITPSAWDIGGSTANTISTGTADDNTVDIQITLDGGNEVSGTDIKDVTTSGATVTDLAGNTMTDIASGDVTEADGAAPVLNSAQTGDADTNGQLDNVQLVFSEALDTSTFTDNDASGFAFTGYTVNEACSDAACTDANIVDDANTNTVYLQLTESGLDDTGTTSTVDYTAGSIADVNAVALATFSGSSSTDGAKPTITDLAIDDTDGDGLIDNIVVTFSENINTDDDTAPTEADFGTTITMPDGSSAGLSGASVTDPAGSSNTVTISSITDQSTANTAAGSTGIAGDISANWADTASNALVSTLDDETVTDNAAPVILASNIVGTTVQGGGDTIDVTFTEDVTGAATKGNWDDFQSPDGTSLTITNAGFSYSNPTLTVTLDESTDGEFLKNGDAVRVDPSAASISDGSGQDVADSSVLSSASVSGDSSAPTISTITTKDNDADGKVDAATVVFNEAVDDSTITTSAWTIGENTAEAVSTGTADDDTVEFQLTTDGNEVSGTDAKDVVSSGSTVTDLAGNALGDIASGDVTEADGASPVVSSITTLDTDTDGKVDAATVVFTENVDTSTFVASEFTIGGTAAESVDDNGDGADDTNVRARITTDGSEISGTDAKDVIFTQSAGTDLASNAATSAASGDITETDGAAPIGTLGTDTDPIYEGDLTQVVTVTYSEAMDTSGTNDPTVGFSGNTGSATSQGDGAWSGGNTWTETFTFADADEETATVTATSSGAQDANGNAETTSVDDTFEIDTLAPTIDTAGTATLSNDAGSDGVASIGDDITYAGGTVASADGDSWTIDLSSYGLSATAGEAAHTIIADDDDGAFTATETVTDDAGNTVSGSVNITGFTNIDNIAPTISSAGTVTLSNDVDGDGVASIGDTITYAAGSVSTSDGDSFAVDLSAYGLSSTASPGNYTIVADNDDGAFSATETVTDDGGNSDTGSVSPSGFTNIDNVAPSISSAGTITLSNDVNGDGKASIGDEITYAVGSVSSPDGDSWTVDLSAYGLSSTATAAGSPYTIVADDDDDVAFSATETVSDDAENTDTGSVTLSGFTNIDNVAPTVTVEPRSTEDTTPPLNGTVDDTGASIQVSVDGQTPSATNNGDGTWTLANDTLTALAVGTYDVTVTATDSANNAGTDSTSGELNIADPTYKFSREINQLPRYATLISNRELGSVTGWSSWTLSDLFESSEGSLSQQLNANEVNTAYIYDGSSWTTRTAPYTWDFNGHDSAFVGYYVLDLDSTATGKWIRHN